MRALFFATLLIVGTAQAHDCRSTLQLEIMTVANDELRFELNKIEEHRKSLMEARQGLFSWKRDAEAKKYLEELTQALESVNQTLTKLITNNILEVPRDQTGRRLARAIWMVDFTLQDIIYDEAVARVRRQGRMDLFSNHNERVQAYRELRSYIRLI